MSREEKEILKALLRGYKRISREMIEMLSRFGLEVTSCNKHYKFIRKDGVGGSVILASTASDHRSGLNAVRYLIRLIEM